MPNSNNSVIIIAVGAASIAANGVGTMFGGASSGFLGAKSPAVDFGGVIFQGV